MTQVDGFTREAKVTPYRVTGGGRTDWGSEIPEQREELTPALFGQGATTEDVLLSENIIHRGTLRWVRKQVWLEPEDSVEFTNSAGKVEEWKVDGWPRVTHLGTTALIRRFK